MSVQQKKISKKEKKVLAFRARKGKGKSGEREALDVPIIDLVRDEENGDSTQTTHQPKKPGNETSVTNKRKRPDVEEDANVVVKEEMPKPKKQKRGVTDTDGEHINMAKTKPEKNDSSKYILFVGEYDCHAEIRVASLYRHAYSIQETLVTRLLKT